MAKNSSGSGCLLFLALGFFGFVFISIFVLYSASETELDGEEGDDEQNNLEILSEDGKDFYESNKEFIENDLAPAGGNMVHWTVLAAIYKEKITDNDTTGCKDHWLGPMKLRELHWVSSRFLKENQQAQTEHSFRCGDINDDFRDQIIDLKTIEKYRQDDKWMSTCLQEEEEKKIEMFCRAFGIDADEDQKADPTQKKDAITSATFLIYNYTSKYKSLASSLYYLYGEDQAFLRKVKNRVLSWINRSEPGSIIVTDGILGWPLSVETVENKNIVKRFKENKQGITIQSKENEPIKSLGWSLVEDVGEEGFCGNFVKIRQPFVNGRQISITYCHLKEVSVEKGMYLEFDQEIGKVGEQPLHIQIREVEGGVSQRVDPEKYLTPPNDVKYGEVN